VSLGKVFHAMQVKSLEIVVPIFNEESNIMNLFSGVDALRKLLTSYQVSLTIVDNGSSDESINVIDNLASKYRELPCKVIMLSRNFGKEASLTAGLHASLGDYVVPVDADLQDPLELIPMMLNKFENDLNIDVVLAVRKTRSDGLIRNFFSIIYIWIFNKLSETKIYYSAGEFQLMSRNYIENFNKLNETERFVRGIFSWMGFNVAIIEYDRPIRIHGKSKFSFMGLVGLGINGIMSHSIKPLRISYLLGFIFALFSFFYSIYILYLAFDNSIPVPGYASIIIILLISSSIQMILIGIVGEYLGKTLLEAKRRPAYVIRRIKNYG